MLAIKYHEDYKLFLTDFITFLKATAEDSWCTDVVRSKDGNCNCLFGHLSNFCQHREDDYVDADFDWFEYNVATVFMVYPVNDGLNAKYTQPTPKERCIAYMEDILSGKEMNTYQGMEEDYRKYKILN